MRKKLNSLRTNTLGVACTTRIDNTTRRPHNAWSLTPVLAHFAQTADVDKRPPRLHAIRESMERPRPRLVAPLPPPQSWRG